VHSKKIFRRVVATAMIFLFILPLSIKAFAGEWQSTIIIIDNEKKVYKIGETINFTIGIADPGGGYLNSADFGIGYSDQTLKPVSTDQNIDHVHISGGPAKWLYYTVTMQVIGSGRVYFIAGASSGAGMIKAVRSDGSVVTCPRASVVYSAGDDTVSPEITPVTPPEELAEADLKSVHFQFTDNDEEIEFEREFDKNITTYSTVLSDEDADREIKITAEAQNPEDQVVIPSSALLKEGLNSFSVTVKSSKGLADKVYTFNLSVPGSTKKLDEIKVVAGLEEIPIDFRAEKYEYTFTVPENVDNIDFSTVGGPELNADRPDGKLDYGCNVKYVVVHYDKKDARYTFYVYRECPKLSLSSMVGELSDDTTLKMDKEFDPSVTEYSAEVPSDVHKVKFNVTVPDTENTYIKQDSTEFELQHGDNNCVITVTDGYNDQDYIFRIFRQEAYVPQAERDPEDKRNFKAFIFGTETDSSWIASAVFVVLILLIAFIIVFTIKNIRKFNKTKTAAADKEEDERKNRLKSKEKEREKQAKLAEKNRKKTIN